MRQDLARAGTPASKKLLDTNLKNTANIPIPDRFTTSIAGTKHK
jgi:hypothetical protein